MNPLNEADRAAFLNLFPDLERSLVANLFLDEVRAGSTAAEYIVRGVWAEVSRRMTNAEHWGSPTDKYLRIQSALEGSRDLALRYAEYCVAYETLSGDDRAKVKASHRAEATTGAWKQDPATERQKWFLGRLGYNGPVEQLSKGDASELIEELKRLGGSR